MENKKETKQDAGETTKKQKSHLLAMTKGEETISVHPRQVGPWEKQGWAVKK